MVFRETLKEFLVLFHCELKFKQPVNVKIRINLDLRGNVNVWLFEVDRF